MHFIFHSWDTNTEAQSYAEGEKLISFASQFIIINFDALRFSPKKKTIFLAICLPRGKKQQQRWIFGCDGWIINCCRCWCHFFAVYSVFYCVFVFLWYEHSLKGSGSYENDTHSHCNSEAFQSYMLICWVSERHFLHYLTLIVCDFVWWNFLSHSLSLAFVLWLFMLWRS